MKALKILSLFVVALMLCIVFAACDEQPTDPVHQHTVVIDEAVAPTCENTGLTEGSHCSECGEILEKQESVNKLEHTPVVDAAVDATCSQEGLTEGSHCSECGEILVKQESVNKLEHTPVVDAAVDATCSQTGLTEGSHCSECGEVLVKQEVVSKIDHTIVIDKAVESTCTSTGLTEGKHCSECKEILVPQQEVSLQEHTYDDRYDALCNVCGYERDADCPHLELETIDGKPATCVLQGISDGKKCVKCGELIVGQKVIAALGHKEVIDAAKAPTCSEIGLTEGKHCSVCNEIIVPQTPIDTLKHTEVIDEAKAPTCTETGLTEGKHCSVCKEIIVAQTVIPMHSWIYGEAQLGGCFKDGTTKDHITAGYYCKDCGVAAEVGQIVFVEGKEVVNSTKYTVTKITHTFDYSGPTTVTAPDCTNYGFKFYACLICTYVDPESIEVFPALGHTYERPDFDLSTLTPTLTDCVADAVTGVITPGKIIYDVVCDDCGMTGTIVEEHTIIVGIVVAPTCYQNGYTFDYCEICDREFNKRNEMKPDANAHNWIRDESEAIRYGDPELYGVVLIPTCTTSGRAYTTCKICSTSKTDVVLPATGHNYYDANGNLTGGVLDSLNGVMVYTCTMCPVGTDGHEYKVDISGSEHIHTYEREDFDKTTVTPSYTLCSGNTPGKIIYDVVCDDCGMTGTIVEEHTIIVGIVVAPTCYQNGYTYDYCEICDFRFNKRNVTKPDANAHDWIRDESEAIMFGHPEWYGIELLPTCVIPGRAYTTCKICGATTQMSIPAYGHFEVILQAKVPTATEAGLTEGKYCSVCNEILVPQQVIPALGHKHTYYDAHGNLIGGELDCLNGVMIYTCASCPAEAVGAVIEVAIEGFDFNDIRFHKDYDKQSGTWLGRWDILAVPDCNTVGVALYECSCHPEKSIFVFSAPEHNIDMATYIPAVEPTCTTDGHIGYVECRECDYKEGDVNGVIEALGHDIDMETYIAPVAPTHTTEGHVGYEKCTREGCDYENGIYGEAGIIDKLS